MKVRNVKGYNVEDQDMSFISVEDLPVVETRYQCGECDEIYLDRDEAVECCKED